MFLFFTFLKVFCLSKFYIHNFCEMIYHGVDNVSIVMRMINIKTTRTVKMFYILVALK